MSSGIEIKPCPFCGMPAVASADGCSVGCIYIDCPGNGCLEVSWDTPEEAAAAWNNRAERRCRNDATEPGIMFECSECGASFVNEPVDGSWGYCPSCGAKVVGDERAD